MRTLLSFFVLAAPLLAGCSSSENGNATEAPPDWETASDRWWKSGTDTSEAFRNLESLEAMGLTEEVTFAASATGITDEQAARQAKSNVLPLYRHEPQVVDSIFAQYVAPELEKAVAAGGDAREAVDQFKNTSYDLLRDHFNEPRERLALGEDVDVTYPDSLRQTASGEVQMQVRLNAEGEPVAVELLEGVHPTLDRIAMRTATQMRWDPAQVAQGSEWQPIPSWVRFAVHFRRPPSAS